MGAGQDLVDSPRGRRSTDRPAAVGALDPTRNLDVFSLIERVRRQPARDHDAEAQQLLRVLK